MAEQKFRVVLAGLIEESADSAAAAALLSEVLRLPTERVARLMTGKRIPLSHELAQSDAEALRDRLEVAGVPASVEPLAELQLEAGLEPQPEAAPTPGSAAGGIEIIEIEAKPAGGGTRSDVSGAGEHPPDARSASGPAAAPGAEQSQADESPSEADLGHEQFFDTRARPAWADLAPAGEPVRRKGPGPVSLGLIGILVLAVLGAGLYLWLGGEKRPPTSVSAPTTHPVEPPGPVPPASEAERKLTTLARSVKVWMIQFGLGYDPTQVTIDRLRKDLGIGDKDLQDPWGTPMRYEPSVDGFRVRSAGPDRQFDTADDLQVTGQM